MEKSIFKHLPYIPNSNKGFTIVELMVASTIGLFIVGLTLTGVMTSRETYQFDLARTQLNQNLRGAADLLGMNTREAGESLAGTFPAVTLTDGGASPDTLTLRRNLMDQEEVARVCQTIAAGSTTSQIYFALTGSVTGCIYPDLTSVYDAWRAHRVAQPSGRVRAYVYDFATGLGEFIDYVSEVDTGVEYYFETAGHVWQNTYPFNPVVGPTTSVFILEEWEFSLFDEPLSADTLQIIENQDLTNPKKVMWGITDFQVTILMADGTVRTDFAPGDPWASIKAVEFTLSGQDSYKTREISNTIVARYFPRNVLSQ